MAIQKFPKTLIIGGVKWKIVFVKTREGGFFRWQDHTLGIEKSHSDDRKFNTLIHEICEIIMTNNLMRFNKCIVGELGNGDYLFSFDHDRFEIFSDELSGILKQIRGR